MDPQTRQKWLDAARARGEHRPAHPPTQPSSPPPPTAKELIKAENDARLLEQLTPRILRLPQEQRNILLQQWQELRAFNELHERGQTRFSLDTNRWTHSATHKIAVSPRSVLPTDREISSIPRAIPSSTPSSRALNSAEAAASPQPANTESTTTHDEKSGNWIYPSQSMFFDAMRRKGHSPHAADMSTIVPIHNAVNERAWSQILAWEKGRGSEACGGPKLVSFEGDSKKVTPKAWLWGMMGYARPFDRHDWVVDRCGKRVDYVIDFYSGSQEGSGEAMPLSFYLDVRPKLNSWDGISTRIARAVGM